MKPRFKLERLAPWVLAVVVLFQAPGVWLGQRAWWSHDLRHHHWPWRDWAARAWSEGHIPLWCADVGAGFPLFADGQVGIWYPVNLVVGLLPSLQALSVGLLLHAAWAALGAWWLARQVGRSPAAALLVGVAYGFGGWLVGHWTYAGMHAVASHFPWLVGLLLGLGAGRWTRVFPAALAVAACMTAGHPQVGGIVGLGAGVVWLAHGPSKRAVLLGVAAAGLGLLAAAPQLAATWELVGQSARAGGVDASFGTMGSLPPWELTNLGSPRLWGWEPPALVPQTYIHKGPGYYGTGETHWEGLLYVGWPVLVLAGAAALKRGQGPWKALVIAGLVLALGGYTPVWWLLRKLPVFDHLRFPVRFGIWAALGLPMLAAWALDTIEDRRRLILACGGVVVVLGLAALTGHAALAVLPIEPQLIPRLGPERTQALVTGLRWSASWGLLLPLGSLALFAGALVTGHNGAVPAVLALDLVVSLWGYNPTTPVDEALRPPAAELPLGLGRTATVDRVQDTALDSVLLSSNLGLVHGTHDVLVPSPLLLPLHEDLLHEAGLDIGMDHGPAKAQAAAERHDLVDLLGVARLISVHELEGYDLVHQGSALHYDNLSAHPRAWWVNCALDAGDDALQTMATVDLSTTVVLDDPPYLPCTGGGSARVIEYSDHAAVIHVDAPGMVVLADTWYPGWVARLDGLVVPVLRADQSLRAVRVEHAGELVFEYRPWWATLLIPGICGWFIALLGALVHGAGTLKIKITRQRPDGSVG